VISLLEKSAAVMHEEYVFAESSLAGSQHALQHRFDRRAQFGPGFE
jgi:hypothetical protein